MNRRCLIGLWVFAWLIPASGQSEAMLSQQDALVSYSCLGCHPSYVNTASEIPYLGGMDALRFVQAMRAFQMGTRPATVMGRIAKGYTQADFISMARFFVQQPEQTRIIREQHDY